MDCLEKALLVYEGAVANHKAVMAAVQAACAAKKGDTWFGRDEAFTATMQDIVLKHRLCESVLTVSNVLTDVRPSAESYRPQANQG